MLRSHNADLKIRTHGKDTYEITDQVSEIVRQSKIQTGLATVFIRHTSASLILFENADRNFSPCENGEPAGIDDAVRVANTNLAGKEHLRPTDRLSLQRQIPHYVAGHDNNLRHVGWNLDGRVAEVVA